MLCSAHPTAPHTEKLSKLRTACNSGMSETITLGIYTYSFQSGGFELSDIGTHSIYFYSYRCINSMKFIKDKRIKLYLTGREYIYICLPDAAPIDQIDLLAQIYKRLRDGMNGLSLEPKV
jgi:hypothetical protein